MTDRLRKRIDDAYVAYHNADTMDRLAYEKAGTPAPNRVEKLRDAEDKLAAILREVDDLERERDAYKAALERVKALREAASEAYRKAKDDLGIYTNLDCLSNYESGLLNAINEFE